MRAIPQELWGLQHYIRPSTRTIQRQELQGLHHEMWRSWFQHTSLLINASKSKIGTDLHSVRYFYLKCLLWDCDLSESLSWSVRKECRVLETSWSLPIVSQGVYFPFALSLISLSQSNLRNVEAGWIFSLAQLQFLGFTQDPLYSKPVESSHQAMATPSENAGVTSFKPWFHCHCNQKLTTHAKTHNNARIYAPKSSTHIVLT